MGRGDGVGRGEAAAAAPSEALPVVSGKVLPANSEPGSQGGAQRELGRRSRSSPPTGADAADAADRREVLTLTLTLTLTLADASDRREVLTLTLNPTPTRT